MNRMLAAVLRLTGLLALAGVMGAAPAACSRAGAGGSADATGKLRVVCTTGMVADLARQVGGERANVVQLMGEGVDPHLYRASTADMRALRQADIVFYTGLHLEGRMVEVLENPGANVISVAVTSAIERDRLTRPPEFEGQYDPHVWFDVSLWMKAVEAVRDGYIRKDPEGREAYEAAAAKTLEEMRALDAWCREQIASIPADRRLLVTAHDAFGYFGRAYGIEVHAIQGISTESEASVKDINNLVDLIVARKVPAVFIESSVPRKTIEALVEGCRARGHEVRIGGELFSDAMGAPGTPEGTYAGMVRHNVNAIVRALGAQGN